MIPKFKEGDRVRIIRTTANQAFVDEVGKVNTIAVLEKTVAYGVFLDSYKYTIQATEDQLQPE